MYISKKKRFKKSKPKFIFHYFKRFLRFGKLLFSFHLRGEEKKTTENYLILLFVHQFEHGENKLIQVNFPKEKFEDAFEIADKKASA